MDQVIKSKYAFWALIIILQLIVLLGIFRLGVMVGFRKASFTYNWGENYRNNFGGPPPGLFGPEGPGGRGGMDDRRFINPHGTAGTILKADNDTLIIKGQDNNEKTVIIGKDTVIRDRFSDILPSDLKNGDGITVIGSPNDSGQIEAKFIRIFRVQK